MHFYCSMHVFYCARARARVSRLNHTLAVYISVISVFFSVADDMPHNNWHYLIYFVTYFISDDTS